MLVSSHHKPGVDRPPCAPTSSTWSVNEVIPEEMRVDGFEFSSTRPATSSRAARSPTPAYRPEDHRRHLAVRRHGGGAFSGKDATKVDRSAAYAARHAAKNIVAAGLADKFEIQLAYAIGMIDPFSIHFDAFGTEKVSPETISGILNDKDLFDFTPRGIIERLGLRAPIYSPTAAYGHFGRPSFSWERTDLADAIRSEAGL